MHLHSLPFLAKLRSWRSPASQNLLRLASFLAACFPFTLSLSPTAALASDLGVVRSPDNVHQWAEIANRLQVSGINYCILQASDWQEEADLQGIRVLLLANVASLNGLQVESLRQWLERGGRAIVTGPTGTLAEPEVREQLKSILGASWGYINSTPATIRPVEGRPSWSNRAQLSDTIIGGVVIPSGTNSSTEAIWLSDGKPPAVVISEKVAFLGWRWGVDNVSPSPLDAAWLQTSLNRLGVRSSPLFSAFSSRPRDCNPTRLPADDTAPILPDLQGKNHDYRNQFWEVSSGKVN